MRTIQNENGTLLCSEEMYDVLRTPGYVCEHVRVRTCPLPLSFILSVILTSSTVLYAAPKGLKTKKHNLGLLLLIRIPDQA